MNINIILAGVGGQGILSIATIIGNTAVKQGLYLKQAEVHGMSQRGGDVQSHLRLSDKEIAADLIPMGKADIIISVEPMEALRYLPMLKPKGWVITNTNPFINIPNYPEKEVLLERINKLSHKIALDADEISKNLGSARSSNMVILGAASPFLQLKIEDIEQTIKETFISKGQEVVDVNIACLHAGRDFADKNK
ncbi:MAG: indolepyruvate oxidoreductase subunit beta [Bacteroidales bacterium]|jgi:indolepyruvate ferredoxin oxidoreductase beta subunit|nr:indolepyruvate oxidoreductase subunit beta [Bacteroidales bacterium]HON20562.1 indolepyruvate oxidoreductase subunit beta [Bacteroidales bacterium]HPX59004.1 indolepyruvate oxidoreductase subunit beta [Bacteroidales bacterium]HQB19384.1 indolepyruvate oxidoreductase subunit beta [Bacteroidales bacterium]